MHRFTCGHSSLLETLSWPRGRGGVGSTDYCGQAAEGDRRRWWSKERRRCSKRSAWSKRIIACSKRNACFKLNTRSKRKSCSKQITCSKRNSCLGCNPCSTRNACSKLNAWWSLGARVALWVPLSLLVASLLPSSGTYHAEAVVVVLAFDAFYDRGSTFLPNVF